MISCGCDLVSKSICTMLEELPHICFLDVHCKEIARQSLFCMYHCNAKTVAFIDGHSILLISKLTIQLVYIGSRSHWY
jgi:hypothetical protein